MGVDGFQEVWQQRERKRSEAAWPDGGERMGKGGKKRGDDVIGLLGAWRMG